MTTKLTAKELAVRLDTDPRTLRKFLRTHNRANGADTPGKGSRWEIEAKQVRSLKKAFIAWTDAKSAKVAASDISDEVLEDA